MMRSARFALASASVAVLGALGPALGCGEVFTSTTGDGGDAGAGGTSTTTATTSQTGGAGTGGVGGSSGTTDPGGSGGAGGVPECQPDTFKVCYSGPDGTAGVGICAEGKEQCVDGKWSACMGETTPGAESCEAGPDGALDESCDGQVDETCSCVGGATQPCYSGPLGSNGTGLCMGGVQTCVGNTWGDCVGEVVPTDEMCDQLDNDCNGKTDTFDAGCESEFALGECAKGSLHCDGGGLQPVCQAAAEAPEACDSKDNDCDGVADNFAMGQGASCQNGSACIGQKLCGSGTFYCIMPTELCENDADDNCDEITDPPSTPYYADDFSGGVANGWQLGTEWAIGPAKASSGAAGGFFNDPGTDTSPSADNMIAGVVLGGNATTQLHEPYHLTSPTVNLNVAGAVYLTFKRYLNSDYPQYMSSTIDVFYANQWITIWHTPTISMGDGGVRDSAWTAQALDVTPFKSAGFRVRFGVEVMSAGALTVSSWNIDDIALVPCLASAVSAD